MHFFHKQNNFNLIFLYLGIWRIYCLYRLYCLYCIVRCSCVVLLRKCREMNVELFRTSHWIQMNVATAFACNTSSSTCVAHLCRSLRQKFANFFTFHHKKEYKYKKYFNSKQIMHIWVWLASKRVKFCNRTFGKHCFHGVGKAKLHFSLLSVSKTWKPSLRVKCIT